MKNRFISKAGLLAVVISFHTLSVSGNGMGTYAISSAARSSDPICREIKDIALLSEKLIINLNSGYSEVTVKYVLWNGSDKDYTDIDYAFPIDYILEDGSRSTPPQIKRIAFYCNDVQLDFAQAQDKVIDRNGPDSITSHYQAPFVNFVQEGMICRRWYYTKFSVKRHSLVRLEVQYSLSNLSLCDGDLPYNLSYFDLCGYKELVYDFSPAASWGDGIIRDFYVEVDGRDLQLAGDQFDYMEDLVDEDGNYRLREHQLVTGLDFERQGNRYMYRTRNFDLKKAKPLYISYRASEINSMDMLTRHMLSPEEYTVRVSREHAAYPKTNLGDMNLETAWTGKKGDWIEFSFRDSCNLAGFCMVNGYHKSAGTYEQNSRVKTLKVEFWGDRDTATTIELPDQPYSPVFFDNLFHEAYYHDFFEDLYTDTGTPPPATKIRFTIEDVYPGTKYDDTCITEIIFFQQEPWSQFTVERYEEQLIETQDKLEAIYHKNPYMDSEGDEALYDSFEEHRNSLQRTFANVLMAVCNQKDTAMAYNFPLLGLRTDVAIATSPDNKMRVFSRDTYTGGQTPDYHSCVLYMADSAVRFSYMPNIGGEEVNDSQNISNENGLLYDMVYVFASAGKRYYLLGGSTQGSSAYPVSGLRAVSIGDGEIRNEQIFRTADGLTNHLSIGYYISNTSVDDERVNVDGNIHSPYVRIVFDPIQNTILVPEVRQGDNHCNSLTGRIMTYKWDGEAFMEQ